MHQSVPALAALLRTLLLLASAARNAAAASSFHVHNPTGAAVTEVHMVQSSHFDGGCKTFGCTATLAAGEPDRCAKQHAEPFAYHIVNRWFDIWPWAVESFRCCLLYFIRVFRTIYAKRHPNDSTAHAWL